jgi:hypothetical protein
MELWSVLLPILLTDVVNPVLFAFLVYAAGTDRPVAFSSSMLLGHTTAYFLVGSRKLHRDSVRGPLFCSN